ncbi:hypothetical protein EC919_11474 [Pseudomonas graminis]|uniref:head-tail connector protein n=1 Tax=Pseudomonas graminis TaxID=158627 RepID=UPI00105F7C90|nr:head-tail connector protein [Pseudomonas graminis]TDV44402.1 hypothetical protein EC919_11474 [Pseudomonas graminis]
MSVIDIELAMHHLLAEPDDQVLIQAQLDAAEEAAKQFMQRRFFLDQATLDVTKANVAARLSACRLSYDAAKAGADLIQHDEDRCRLLDQAWRAYIEAVEDIDMDAYGIVMNPAIRAACLLKLGHLYANREEVVAGSTVAELPLASKSLLMPYRIGMGV